MDDMIQKKKRLTSFQLIIIGFSAVILIGAFLLMLPISSSANVFTPFNEALFTATSAVCVTGLVVQDTAMYWSFFGELVILLLIQIGGLGIITVAVSFALFSGKKISLMQRSTMQESIAAFKVGGIVRLTSFILKVTFMMEAIGACLMMPVFCKTYGLKGIWMAIFHSISAFCNAGFDIFGQSDALFTSLTSYSDHFIINMTVMLLIVIGGIGFLTWEDLWTNKHHFKKYRMQSKVILVTTGLLILLPALYFYFFEFDMLSGSERVFVSFFQSVTTRTAGFNTIDLNIISSSGLALMIVLMLIGGSPGSTAGGMKTTTFAVLLANMIAVFNRKEDAHFFNRRIDKNVIRNASTILMLYVTMFFSGAFVISVCEGIDMGVALFECASAVGTVGLTLGITPDLCLLSQIVLILLMFFGRVGGLTLIYAAISGNKNTSKLPQEKITVG